MDRLCRASPTCLLRTAGVGATMDQVLARLRAAPMVFPDGRVLDAPRFMALVSSARIACIDNAAESYLFELRVPPEGFACAARPVMF